MTDPEHITDSPGQGQANHNRGHQRTARKPEDKDRVAGRRTQGCGKRGLDLGHSVERLTFAEHRPRGDQQRRGNGLAQDDTDQGFQSRAPDVPGTETFIDARRLLIHQRPWDDAGSEICREQVEVVVIV